MIDLVQPYVEIIGLDAPADAARGGGGLAGLFGVGGAGGGDGCARLRWRVWGAIRVDRTHAVWRRADERGSARWRPASPPVAGDGVWASAAARGGGGGGDDDAPSGGVFSACVALPRGGRRRAALAAVAVVDGAWGARRGAAGVAARRAAADTSPTRAPMAAEPRGQRPPRAGAARVALGGQLEASPSRGACDASSMRR